MKLRHPFLIAAVVALAVLGAATAGIVTTPSSATKTTIKVTEKEFHITLSSHKATAGQVRFEIKNTGKYPHGFAISGAGVKLKKIAAIEAPSLWPISTPRRKPIASSTRGSTSQASRVM